MDKGITGYMKPIVATLIILIGINPAKAQTTQFTYQGKLSDGGSPANGTYDFQFGLFDTATVGTGSQFGTTLTLTNITVTNGLFTVPLDFGACPTCFNGASRYLEIAVKKTLGSTFTTLSPRQPLSSTPYAIRSLNAAAADGLSVACVNCVTSSQIASVSGSAVSGPIPVASLPAGSGNYIQNQNASAQSGDFNISGSGTAGTLSGTVVNATTQFNLGGNRVLSAPGTANLFAGFGTGAANTTGLNNAFFGYGAGAANTTGNGNVFFGRYAGLANSIGSNTTILGSNAGLSNTAESDNTFVGASSNGAAGITNATAIGSRAAVSQSNSLVLGSISGVNGATASVNVGIGTTAPTSRLHVVGDINTTTQYNLGGNRMLAVSGVGSYVNMNTFAGVGAGISTTPSEDGLGSFNAFFGYQAGLLNTAGSDNSFFGFQAGRNNTTGVVNSFFGQEAGKNNTTGSENSFFGRYAGVDNGEGFSNTFIGYGADFTNLNSTGNFNTLLGTFSRVTAGVSNATAIGARATVTQSNTLVLGSINGVSGATADTNVGIGTTAPSFRLHVRAAGQDGIKIQHNGTSDYPQIRWTDASDAFKASIGVGPVGSEGMHFFVNGADRLIIENTGTLWLSNLGAAGSTQLCRNASNQIATCSSSLRYKTDIQPFTSGLDLIKRLRPIAFVWKQDGMRDLGLAAEEVAEVEPLLVTHNDKGEVEGVKYDRINVLLINAVKQQQEQISRQQALVTRQQGQIKQQEAAINQQQQQLKQQQSQIDTLKKLVCLDHPDASICK